MKKPKSFDKGLFVRICFVNLVVRYDATFHLLLVVVP